MTIHFHSKHFENQPLPLTEYMMLMMYEQRSDISIKELMKTLKISERTVIRIRNLLTDNAYLEKSEKSYYSTNKLYAK